MAVHPGLTHGIRTYGVRWILFSVLGTLSISASAGTTSYTYDVHGRLKTVVSPNGSDQTTLTYSFDNADNPWQVVTTSQDLTPPNVPTGLSAVAQAFDRIRLNWIPTTDVGGGPVSYKLYRGGSPVATPGAPPYDDQPLGANTPYTYNVSAVDTAGNESAQSGPASATTPPGADLVPPSAPYSLAGTAVSGTWINLTWGASTDTGGSGLGGYEVYRNGAYLSSSTVPSYSDQAATPATSFQYTVRAYDLATPTHNYSGFSNQIAVATPDTVAPGAPGQPVISAITGSTASITWGDASDNVGVTGYQYRLNSGIWIDTARPVNLTGLVVSTTYTVEARARDAAGNWGSASSNSFVTSAYYIESLGYQPALTYDNGNMGTFVGYLRNAGFGALSPNTLLPNKVVEQVSGYVLMGSDGYNWWVEYEYSALLISGFTSTPTADWLQSVSIPGATLTGATAAFSCSNGSCGWTWPTADLAGGGPLTIVHK
jgi:YD repeat-containing protein